MPHGINVGGATPLVLLSLHNRAVLLVTRQKIACNDVSNGLSNTFILNELDSLRGSVLNEVGKCEGFRQSNLFDTYSYTSRMFTPTEIVPTAKRMDGNLLWSLNTREVFQLYFKSTCSFRTVSV